MYKAWETLPQNGVQHKAVRFIQTLDNSIFEGAIKSGNVNLFLIGVIAGPEEITWNPVHRQTMSIRNIWSQTHTHKRQKTKISRY